MCSERALAGLPGTANDHDSHGAQSNIQEWRYSTGKDRLAVIVFRGHDDNLHYECRLSAVTMQFWNSERRRGVGERWRIAPFRCDGKSAAAPAKILILNGLKRTHWSEWVA